MRYNLVHIDKKEDPSLEVSFPRHASAPKCIRISKYSSNKIRNTQNEHLNIARYSKFEQSVIVNLMPIS